MAITYTQAAVNAAVELLMHGGPGGGELTIDQYNDMCRVRGTQAQPTDFLFQIQLAIQQNNPALATSRNICRDFWGVPNDAFFSYYWGPIPVPGVAARWVQQFGVSISG